MSTEVSEAQQKDQAFAQQESLMTQVYADPEHGLENMLHRLPAAQREAFLGVRVEAKQQLCACIDEGIPLESDQQGRVRVAGSGILLGRERAQQLWQETGVTTVTAHAECGAAAKYCQDNRIDTDNPSQHVAGILQQWAQEAGLQFEYIDRLNRPAFHDARMTIIDGTAALRPTEIKPFVVTADRTTDEIAQDALLAASIALGHHGLAERFTANRPFVIGLLGDASQQLLMARVRQQLEQDDWFVEQQGRVVVQNATLLHFAAADELPQAAD